jgi:hypothetical protein
MHAEQRAGAAGCDEFALCEGPHQADGRQARGVGVPGKTAVGYNGCVRVIYVPALTFARLGAPSKLGCKFVLLISVDRAGLRATVLC